MSPFRFTVHFQNRDELKEFIDFMKGFSPDRKLKDTV